MKIQGLARADDDEGGGRDGEGEDDGECNAADSGFVDEDDDDDDDADDVDEDGEHYEEGDDEEEDDGDEVKEDADDVINIMRMKTMQIRIRKMMVL